MQALLTPNSESGGFIGTALRHDMLTLLNLLERLVKSFVLSHHHDLARKKTKTKKLKKSCVFTFLHNNLGQQYSMYVSREELTYFDTKVWKCNSLERICIVL
jgi:hypothetical protein